MKTWFISLGCLLLAEAFAGTSGTPNLTIEVRGIERPEGSLFVAVYASEETFLKKPLTGFRVEAKDSTVRIPVRDFPQEVTPFPSFTTPTETVGWTQALTASRWRSMASATMPKA